jgi:hypothetical protein
VALDSSSLLSLTQPVLMTRSLHEATSVARAGTRGAQAAAGHLGGRRPLGGGQAALQWRSESERDGDFVSQRVAAETFGSTQATFAAP